MKKPTQAMLARWGRAWEALRHSDAGYAPDVLELLDMLYEQWMVAGSFQRIDQTRKIQTGQQGGRATPNADLHAECKRLWLKDTAQRKSDVVRSVLRKHPDGPAYRTLYNRLQKVNKK